MLPINQSQAEKASAWLETNFGDAIKLKLTGTKWTVEEVKAIACKETAYKWLYWIDKHEPEDVLARCVFDTSGEPEFPNAVRSAFPQNRDVFRAHYGAKLLDLLVAENNLQRKMPQAGYPLGFRSDAPFLAKGYGIFQYDIQNIVIDYEFFSERKWYSMTNCLQRLLFELNGKLKYSGGKKMLAIQMYNGSGAKAEQYAKDVSQLMEWV